MFGASLGNSLDIGYIGLGNPTLAAAAADRLGIGLGLNLLDLSINSELTAAEQARSAAHFSHAVALFVSPVLAGGGAGGGGAAIGVPAATDAEVTMDDVHAGTGEGGDGAASAQTVSANAATSGDYPVLSYFPEAGW
jgi:hypothetical protein